LIDLLADNDAEIRVFAAAALQRLTGQNHGRSPEQWRQSAEECAATLEEWRQWWSDNRHLYSPPLSTRSPSVKSNA
jgi:hypothetical protein